MIRQHLFNRILYPTVFPDNAERALDAFSHLRRATREATLVHVEPPKDQSERDPETELSDLAEKLDGWDIDTEVEVRQGDPATEILDVEAAITPTTPCGFARAESAPATDARGRLRGTSRPGQGAVYMVPPPRTA